MLASPSSSSSSSSSSSLSDPTLASSFADAITNALQSLNEIDGDANQSSAISASSLASSASKSSCAALPATLAGEISFQLQLHGILNEHDSTCMQTATALRDAADAEASAVRAHQDAKAQDAAAQADRQRAHTDAARLGQASTYQRIVQHVLSERAANPVRFSLEAFVLPFQHSDKCIHALIVCVLLVLFVHCIHQHQDDIVACARSVVTGQLAHTVAAELGETTGWAAAHETFQQHEVEDAFGVRLAKYQALPRICFS